ncbi:ATP-grasp domain-containing protein [Roseobacter weihaiensis]|uniref:ATP-grasp domain-containing protein n=1 Tax=Roseobacter weihaiensis TaxID=2763262 RepID=UPI001D09BA93|nr:ATP-grasp domain-containing protein [Roseobacter sp. H9]
MLVGFMPSDPFRVFDMERWPPSLRDLLGEHDEVPLSQDDLRTISAATPGFGRRGALSNAVLESLEDLLPTYPDGAHLRLGACSFKADRAPSRPIRTLKDATDIMMRPNLRIASVIHRLLEGKYDTSLFLIPWRKIPPWGEFRAFVQDGAVIGLSQYRTDSTFAEITQNPQQWADRVTPAVWSAIEAGAPDPAVVDVAFVPQDNVVCFLEINPFSTATDPCLFSWDDPYSFDGTFRFVRPGGTPDRKV